MVAGGGGGGGNDVMVEWLVGYLVLTSCQSVKPQGAIETQKLGRLLCVSCHCALVCEPGIQTEASICTSDTSKKGHRG